MFLVSVEEPDGDDILIQSPMKNSVSTVSKVGELSTAELPAASSILQNSLEFQNKLNLASTSKNLNLGQSKLRRSSRTFLIDSTDSNVMSSSESDPFAGDNEDLDPDFILEKTQREIRRPEREESLSDSSTSSIEPKRERKARKRVKNQKNWQRNKMKKLKNSGKSYTDWRGNDRPERKLKDPCRNCRLKCVEKISEELRYSVFKAFWDLEDINRQRDYIAKYVNVDKKARNRRRKIENLEQLDENSKRTFTFTYYFPAETSKVQVCKIFFLNTLSISAQTVRTVFNKMSSVGTVSEDRRGKACKNSMLDESIKQTVRNHINLFETIDSHYCRQKTSRKYLPPTLNISKMFNLYEEYCVENHIEKMATESMYRHIFTTEFNISFFLPKKDLCDTCHKYDNSNHEEKLLLDKDYKLHMKNKDLARELKTSAKDKAKENASFCAATFDLQQVLSAPKTEVGIAYYKLKMSVFNFTIFNLASKKAFCYMWHECIAKRGSSEIGSCLLIFIEQEIRHGVTQFSFFSDSCPGQNRNKYLFSLYNYLTQKYAIQIQHTFLEKGHTQSEGDSVHSVIEKAARNIPVYTPDQWYTLVRTSKRKNPYVVVEMSQENIFDLKKLQQLTSINWEKNETNDKIYWNQLKIVQTNPQYPNIIFYKESYSEEDPFKRIPILNKGRRSLQFQMKDVHLLQLYKELIPLTKKKNTNI